MAAIAEKLWSPRAKTADTAQAEARLLDFRCTPNERAVRAAPVLNHHPRPPPPGPGPRPKQRRRRPT